MFSSAWPRSLFLVLLFSPLSHAKQASLFTSSVTYCEPPESLLVRQFNVAFIAPSRSISFNISVSSVDKDVKVNANLLVNVYGMTPANITLDLCNILGGALCPLPMYNFTGSASVPLPESIGDTTNRIPGIAFKIPDLEGFAQLKLTEIGTGKVKACVQATLSNGWSSYQPAVGWTTGALTVATLILAAVWSTFAVPDAVIPYRILDMVSLYQSIAASALLALNYPSVYRAFADNFAWSLGLFSSRRIQSSIDKMRHLTGGQMANSTAESAVGLVNRKLSPFNLGLLSNARSFSMAPSEVQTVTEVSPNILQAGIPIYVNSIHIATANAFMTVFISALMVLAVALAILASVYAAIISMKWTKKLGDERLAIVRYRFTSAGHSWLVRVALLIFYPLMIFIFYQWTLKDSWLSILLSVVSLVVFIPCVGYPIYQTLKLAQVATPHALYSHAPHFPRYASLYGQYRVGCYYFFLALQSASFLKAIVIALGSKSGLAQIILILLIELLGLISLVILRPHKTRGTDALSIYVTVVRIVGTSLMIAFIDRVDVKPIPRVVIGLVIAVLYSVAVIVLLINLTYNLALAIRGHASDPQDTRCTEELTLEKGSVGSDHTSASRPTNPTPDRNLVEKNSHLRPMTPTTLGGESIRIRDSASTNLGSLLPRRWSFTPLNSPTASSDFHASTTPQSMTLCTPETSTILTRNHDQH